MEGSELDEPEPPYSLSYLFKVLRLAVQVGDFPTAEDVVDVLKERLHHHLGVREEEHRWFVLRTCLEIEFAQVWRVPRGGGTEHHSSEVFSMLHRYAQMVDVTFCYACPRTTQGAGSLTLPELLQSVVPSDLHLKHLKPDDVGCQPSKTLPATAPNANKEHVTTRLTDHSDDAAH